MIGQTVSHYRIIEKLGEGGMGEVFLAEDTKLDRKVALKFLPPHFTKDPEFKARFEHEAKAAAALNHPNIVTVYELSEYQDRLFIAMEYIDGEALGSLIEAGDLSLDRALDVTRQICEGLREAHRAEVVHRDIKPSNIFVDARGYARILDFGLAKSRGTKADTQAGTMVGTLQYGSPEQTVGKPADARSDLFSLGSVLYEMITGRPPFAGEIEDAIRYSILNEDPEPLARYKSRVPDDLQQLVSKLLEKDPELRYQSAAGVLSDLKRLEKARGAESEDERSRPSIAVLPFANLSADPEQEYFCDGVTEEIINALTHVEDLRVIARTSAFAFKGRHEDVRNIGRTLGVNTLLEGTVRKAGDRVRITAQLIDARDGSHLWSERYDEEMQDVFAIQDKISLAIMKELEVRLLQKEEECVCKHHTENIEAYNLYLKGRYFWNKWTDESLKTAIRYFERAIEIDPEYALAYAGLADAYSSMGTWVCRSLAPTESMAKARAAATRALELDDQLADAHSALACIALNYDWDFQAAELSFRQALELNPGSANACHQYSHCLIVMGRMEESLAMSLRAQGLDPIDPEMGVHLAWHYICAHEYENAVEAGRKTLELDPMAHEAVALRARAYGLMGMLDEAIEEYQRALELSGRRTDSLSSYGHLCAVAGRQTEAEAILEELMDSPKQRYVPSFSIALVHLGLGHVHEAFQWLEKALKDRFFLMLYLGVDARFDPVRDDPRFVSLLQRIRPAN
jgi:serine/threonine protein kinase/Tfp pilus assembly protein PilF